MSAPTPHQSTQSLVSYVTTNLIVRQLQTILRAVGLPITGLKKTLQDRLIDKIYELSRNNDQEGLERLRAIIYKPDSVVATSSGATQQRVNGIGSSASPKGTPGYYNAPHTYGSGPPAPRMQFRPSPFYSVLETLTPMTACPIIPNHRNMVLATVQLNQAQIQNLNANTHKAMVYCACMEAGDGLHEIAFPQQVELRVNSQPVQANLRGLKNKPGSTRPADITNYLTKVPAYKNQVQLTYAHTQKKFAFVVNLVKFITVETLVQQLQESSRRISKESVISDMVRRNNDSDVVATSSVMSLKCPLSTLRIDLPIRSSICTHVQCFDASSFLQLQQQAPTWACPACSKSIPYELLVVDNYVQDILDSTSKNVESVTIDPRGQWSVQSQETLSPDSSPDSDDDIIEIPDTRSKSMRKEPTPITPLGSREDPHTRSSSKRPASQVIDLTLSDDDEPPRPTKRVQHQPNGQGATFPVTNGFEPRRNIEFALPSRPRTFGSTSSTPDSY